MGQGGAGGDQALCTAACSTFQGCGVMVSATCASACTSASPNYRSCLSAAGADCNALALCYFTAVAPTDCPAGGGVPAGSATCATTDTCQGTCNTNGSPASCGCACAAAIDPTLANDLLVINSCALEKCAGSCGSSGTHGSDCNSCFQQMCASQRAACLAQ